MYDADAANLVDDLEALLDRFDELYTISDTSPYVAVAHKLREAAGPLASALEAAEQYRDGILEA